MIGASRVAVIRYRDGKRIPRSDIMARILAATAGKVRPDDFFSSAEAAA